jgi:hypothetical protein
MLPSAAIRFVTSLALALLGSQVCAGPLWAPVAQTEDSVYLLDESSIEVRAGLLTAWELVEYAWPQYENGVSYRSQVNLRAYRCQDRSWDVLRVTRYAGPQSSGDAVLSSNFTPSATSWNHAPPESVAAHMLERVCAIAGAQSRNAALRTQR